MKTATCSKKQLRLIIYCILTEKQKEMDGGPEGRTNQTTKKNKQNPLTNGIIGVTTILSLSR